MCFRKLKVDYKILNLGFWSWIYSYTESIVMCMIRYAEKTNKIKINLFLSIFKEGSAEVNIERCACNQLYVILHEIWINNANDMVIQYA